MPALDCVVVAPHVWSAHSPSVVKRKIYTLLIGWYTAEEEAEEEKYTHTHNTLTH